MGKRTYLVEHKSTSSGIAPGEAYWRHLAINNETPLYLSAARALGHDVHGVVYDVLRKPALRPKVAETPEEFRVRCLGAIAETPDEYLARATVVRSRQEIEEATIDLLASTKAIREARRRGVWIKQPHSCERYHRWCEYFPVCNGEARITDDVRFEDRETSETISKSGLETWHRCPREFFFGRVLGRQAKRADTGPLAMGVSMHKALDTWASGSDMPDVVMRDPFEAAKLNAMVAAYACRWSRDEWEVVAIEKEFSVPVRHPVTRRKTKEVLHGFIDAIVRIDA